MAREKLKTFKECAKQAGFGSSMVRSGIKLYTDKVIEKLLPATATVEYQVDKNWGNDSHHTTIQTDKDEYLILLKTLRGEGTCFYARIKTMAGHKFKPNLERKVEFDDGIGGP